MLTFVHHLKSTVMLGKLKAFIPTVKPGEARVFYRDVLGLTLISSDPFADEFEADGTRLRVTIVPKLAPQEFTVLGWHVDNIRTAIRSLYDKGIRCQQYGFPDQDELGIWTAPGGTKVAWFKDPDGNLLSLDE